MKPYLLTALAGAAFLLFCFFTNFWPELPVRLPFGRHITSPGPQFMAATVVVPQLTGSAGFTVNQLMDHFSTIHLGTAWTQSDTTDHWVLRVDGRDEMTDTPMKVALKFEWLADPSQAGLHSGPAVVVTDIVVNGQHLPDAVSGEFLDQLGYSLNHSQ